MASVEELYRIFGVLADAKDKAGEHEEEFLQILSAVKGSTSEKRLASQFVTRFFKYFPKQAYQAINAIFDLCEDDDINIRKQAIKDLPNLCKVNSEHVSKISEALTQLLQCDDPTEYSLVQTSLGQLFSVQAKGTLVGIFAQVHAEDDGVREKAIKFLTTYLKKLPEDTLNKDSQDFVVEECKKVLQDVTKEEFINIMEILKSLTYMNTVQGRQQLLDIVTEQAVLQDVTKEEFINIMEILKSLTYMNTVQGRQQLLDIVTEQAELDQPFEAADSDIVDRLVSCVKHAAPLFSKNVHSKAFVNYISNQVLPILNDIVSTEEGTDSKLDVLKLLAEICEHNGFTAEDVKLPLENVFKRLLEYMPLPPPEVETESDLKDEPKLQFSYVECLMFVFHQLGRKYTEFLTAEENAERMKDFKLRLQYFARGVQIYIKQLRQDLIGVSGDALKTEENKLKVAALKVTSNINGLIKDLFHNPPAYKCIISLSWKPVTRPTVPSAAGATNQQLKQKRFTAITYDDSNGASNPKKAAREARQLYTPPSGKFSEKAGEAPKDVWNENSRSDNTGNFRGGNRGRFRGKNRGNRGRGNFRRY